MQVSPDQGALLALLVRLIGARRVVEVGTFTGYSSLCHRPRPARRRAAAVLRRQRGVDGDRPALLGAGRGGGPDRAAARPGGRDAGRPPADPIVDLAFIDADKTGYARTTRRCCPACARAGSSWSTTCCGAGAVIDPAAQDPDTQAIRAFNDRVAGDDRVESVMVGIADGLTLARKR